MQNEIRPEEDAGIIYSIYHGDQTKESIHDITVAAKEVITKLRGKQKPVYILIDVRDVKNQDSGGRKAAIDGINTLDYDKMAIFGASLMIKYVAQFLIRTSHMQDKVKYFTTEAEARAWLAR